MQRRVFLIICFFLFSTNGEAIMAPPVPIGPLTMPADRLLKNIEAYMEAHPQDPQGHYTKGRIHYHLFARRFFAVNIVSSGEEKNPLPQIASGYPARPHGGYAHSYKEDYAENEISALRDEVIRQVLEEQNRKSLPLLGSVEHRQLWAIIREKERSLVEKGWKPALLSAKEAHAHAIQAVQSFQKALELDPQNALYLLGFASLLEQFAEHLREPKSEEVPLELKALLSREKIAALYYQAHKLSLEEDAKIMKESRSGPGGASLLPLASHEAGRGYLRLTQDRKIKNFLKRQEVEASLDSLEKLARPVAISPIILSLKSVQSIDELLDKTKEVDFDLRGIGRKERWLWIKPSVGLLVWDPYKQGEIVSGKQLFGNVTFWLFWNHGYEALGRLDDDRDGELTQGELHGLRVWFDRNSNGVSESGEVKDLDALGIESFSVQEWVKEGEHLKNPLGLKMRDGRILPTWDWMAKSVSEPSE